MKLRKRYVIPIVVVVLLAAGGVSLRWYLNTPAQRAKRLVAELRNDPPGTFETWLIKARLLKPNNEGRDQREVMKDIVAMGTVIVPMLIEAAADDGVTTLVLSPDDADDSISIYFNYAAQLLLRDIGAPALPALLEATSHPDPKIRAATFSTLGYMLYQNTRDTHRIRAVCLQALKDPDANVRTMAIWTLAGAGPTRQAAPGLRDALRDESAGVRQAAVFALYKVQPMVVDAVADFRKALGDKVWRVRSMAAAVLGGMGSHAREAAPDLRAALKDSNEHVRRAAVGSLGLLGSATEETLADLREILADEKSGIHVRSAAAGALVQLDPPPSEEVLAVLREALTSGGVLVRRSAASVLGEIGHDAKVAPDLEAALKDKDSFVRMVAAHGLRKMGAGAREAIPALREALSDKGENVRLAAAWALATIAPPPSKQVISVLQKALGSDSSYTRHSAALALGEAGVAAKDALPVLREALKDERKNVRDIAAWAIKKIQAATQRAQTQPAGGGE